MAMPPTMNDATMIVRRSNRPRRGNQPVSHSCTEVDRAQEVDGTVEERPEDQGADDHREERRREQQRPDDGLLAEAAPVAAEVGSSFGSGER